MISNAVKIPELRKKVDDVRIAEMKELITPESLMARHPLEDKFKEIIFQTRNAISEIVHGRDNRILAVVGPCSIHDPSAALDYAGRLAEKTRELTDQLLVVMRVYFEKPRTTVGWKGLINDPYLDGSFKINDGLEIARKLLLDIHKLGLTAATEYLDMITPQFLGDLISWGAIGARTTESQVHRELASGLSCPVGFKNGTDGNIQIAVDAAQAASHPHHFLSVTKTGHTAIVSTNGNPDCHVILRGGKQPNYDRDSVRRASDALKKQGLPAKLMVDCSHANSAKDHTRQAIVAREIAAQLPDRTIMGVMIESNLVSGRQNFSLNTPMTYGQSVTDACIGIEETFEVLEMLAESNARC
jgi:3-deoxy-7-phosphoheptulonate synthase